jgi:choline monooxygenase
MPTSLDTLLARFDPDLPLDRAQTIPAVWYSDPALFAAERARVFGAAWLPAGRTDQVARPGSFFTTDLGGEPVLVTRADDGVLRAFFNVCRHRAARVACEAEGQAVRLHCRYHGWTYDLAGRLRGVPEFDGVQNFRREDNGLLPVHIDTWGPLVWVYLGADPPPLRTFLAPLIERCGELVENLKFVARREYELKCNWKVFVDNYLDGGYHVNTIHPGLAGVIDYTRYRTEVFETSSVQISPLATRGNDPAEEAAVRQVRGGDTAWYWWLFPSFMLNLYQGVLDTNLVLPLGPDRSRVIFDFYFASTEGPEAEEFMASSMAVAHQIQLEDVGICEEVQQGLGSRSYDTGRFSVRREAGGYHFHQLLARKLRGYTNP